MIIIVSVKNVPIVIPCKDGRITVREVIKEVEYRFNDLYSIKYGRADIDYLCTLKEQAMIYSGDIISDVCNDRDSLRAILKTSYPNSAAISPQNMSQHKYPEKQETRSIIKSTDSSNQATYMSGTSKFRFGYSENNYSSEEKRMFYEVYLPKTKEGLGLKLASCTLVDESNETRIIVKEVLKNGSADLDGNIVANDILVKLNSEAVDKMTLTQICENIQRTQGNVKLGLIRSQQDQYYSFNPSISSDHQDCAETYYGFTMPLGFVIDDVGLVIDVCCGVYGDLLTRPSIFIQVNQILTNSIFNMICESTPTKGQVLTSLMGFRLENLSEDSAIKNIKMGYLKLLEEGYFEITVRNHSSNINKMITIFEECHPSFFVPHQHTCYHSSNSDYSDTELHESYKSAFLLPPYRLNGKSSRDETTINDEHRPILTNSKYSSIQNDSITNDTLNYSKSTNGVSEKTSAMDLSEISDSTINGQNKMPSFPIKKNIRKPKRAKRSVFSCL